MIVCMPSTNPQSQVSATNSKNGRASQKYMMNMCAYNVRGGHVLYLASENTAKCAIIL